MGKASNFHSLKGLVKSTCPTCFLVVRLCMQEQRILRNISSREEVGRVPRKT